MIVARIETEVATDAASIPHLSQATRKRSSLPIRSLNMIAPSRGISDGADAIGDLPDLFLGMGVGIARMWLDLTDRDRRHWMNLRLRSKPRVAPVRF